MFYRVVLKSNELIRKEKYNELKTNLCELLPLCLASHASEIPGISQPVL